MDKATAPLKGVENNLKKIDKAATGMNKKFLGLGLGLTFFLFGVKMQLDRMLRSMFNIFKQAEGETGALIQKFDLMKASLAAISIAFFDAFAQSGLFDMIIAFVIKVADWFLNLDDSTKQWLSSSLFVFSGIIFGLSLVGQALLAIFVLSNLNPIVLGVSLAVIAIGALVLAFVLAKDDIKSAVSDIKTDWDKFVDAIKGVTFENLFKNLGTVLLRMRVLLIDFALWFNTIPLLGLLQPKIVTEGLIAKRESLLDRLEPERVTGGFGPEAGFTPEGIASHISGGIITATGEIIKGLTENPLPIDDKEGLQIKPFGSVLDIFNKEDAKKIEELQKLIMDNEKNAKDEQANFDSLIASVNAIELKPVINVVVEGGSGGGSPTQTSP